MSVRRSLAVLVCWTLLLGSLTTPAVAGAAVTGAGAPAVEARAPAAGVGPPAAEIGPTVPPDGVAPTTNPAVVQANNTTVRHRDPDGRNEDGDLGAVQSYLAARMGEVVVDCSRAVSAGEFDPCERLNGSYNDTLSAYVEVSRETRTERDDESARAFRRARSPLASFVYEWAGLQNASYLLMDCEEKVRRVLELMEEQERPVMDAVCEVRPPLVHFRDNLSSDNLTGF